MLTQTGQSFKARAPRRAAARGGVRTRRACVLARGARRRAACAQPLTHDARPDSQVKGVEFAEKAEDRVDVERLAEPKDAASAPAKKGDTVHVACAHLHSRAAHARVARPPI